MLSYFIKQKVRRPIIVLLHLSFVVILAGALLTHLTAKQGIIYLYDGGYFLSTRHRFVGQKAVQVGTLLFVGRLKSVDKQIGFLR